MRGRNFELFLNRKLFILLIKNKPHIAIVIWGLFFQNFQKKLLFDFDTGRLCKVHFLFSVLLLNPFIHFLLLVLLKTKITSSSGFVAFTCERNLVLGFFCSYTPLGCWLMLAFLAGLASSFTSSNLRSSLRSFPIFIAVCLFLL